MPFRKVPPCFTVWRWSGTRISASCMYKLFLWKLTTSALTVSTALTRLPLSRSCKHNHQKVPRLCRRSYGTLYTGMYPWLLYCTMWHTFIVMHAHVIWEAKSCCTTIAQRAPHGAKPHHKNKTPCTYIVKEVWKLFSRAASSIYKGPKVYIIRI